jgi:hypothetical protein
MSYCTNSPSTKIEMYTIFKSRDTVPLNTEGAEFHFYTTVFLNIILDAEYI